MLLFPCLANLVADYAHFDFQQLLYAGLFGVPNLIACPPCPRSRHHENDMCWYCDTHLAQCQEQYVAEQKALRRYFRAEKLAAMRRQQPNWCTRRARLKPSKR